MNLVFTFEMNNIKELKEKTWGADIKNIDRCYYEVGRIEFGMSKFWSIS